LKANIKRRAGGRNANGQWYEKKKDSENQREQTEEK
jgi:hypothetical protein